jgi:hypothetical protein
MPSYHSSQSSSGVGNSSLLRCSQNDLMSLNEQDYPAWTAKIILISKSLSRLTFHFKVLTLTYDNTASFCIAFISNALCRIFTSLFPFTSELFK